MDSTLFKALFKPQHFDALISNNAFLCHLPSQGRESYINSKPQAPVTYNNTREPEGRRQKGTCIKQLPPLIVKDLPTTPNSGSLDFCTLASPTPTP